MGPAVPPKDRDERPADQPPDQRFVPGGGRSADHLFRNVVSLIGSRFPSEINSRVPDQPSNFYNRWLIMSELYFFFTAHLYLKEVGDEP